MLRLIKTFCYICAVCSFSYSLTACSSNKAPEPLPVPKIQNSENIGLNWEVGALSQSPAGSFAPTLDDGAIFTADSKGEILRIDATDGSIIKKFNLKRKLSSGTATSSSAIFVTTQDAYLLSVDKVTGSINWQVQLPTISIEAPQISGNIIVVKTNDSELMGYDISDGHLIWIYQRQNPPLTLRADNTFQVVGKDVVILGQPGGRIALINVNNGTPIWENYVAIPEGATDLDKLTDVAMRPVVNERNVCVASFNGKITCLDAISSNIIWAKKFSSSSGIVVDEQNVYAVSVDGIVYAFDKNTGAQIWQNDILRYRVLGIPVFWKNNLLILDSDGYLNLFSRDDGKLVGHVASNLKGGYAYPLVDSEKIYIQSGNGHLAEIKH